MSHTSKKKSKAKTATIKKLKYYSDIRDIPYYNWERIIQHGQTQFIIVEERLRHYKLDEARVTECMDKMTDQYLQEMGINMESDEFFVLIRQRIIYRHKVIMGDKSALNFVKSYTDQINEIKKTHVKPNLAKSRILVGKWNGNFDAKLITVYDFIQMAKCMEEEAAALRANRKNSDHEQGT